MLASIELTWSPWHLSSYRCRKPVLSAHTTLAWSWCVNRSMLAPKICLAPKLLVCDRLRGQPKYLARLYVLALLAADSIYRRNCLAHGWYLICTFVHHLVKAIHCVWATTQTQASACHITAVVLQTSESAVPGENTPTEGLT